MALVQHLLTKTAHYTQVNNTENLGAENDTQEGKASGNHLNDFGLHYCFLIGCLFKQTGKK